MKTVCDSDQFIRKFQSRQVHPRFKQKTYASVKFMHRSYSLFNLIWRDLEVCEFGDSLLTGYGDSSC